MVLSLWFLFSVLFWILVVHVPLDAILFVIVLPILVVIPSFWPNPISLLRWPANVVLFSIALVEAVLMIFLPIHVVYQAVLHWKGVDENNSLILDAQTSFEKNTSA
jgi:hypothetical protein